ncbi:type IV pilus modification protein PilV [Acinetobacter ursingii]|uniref:type IV pilus modification protein PilV n=1 Tax=Acinetobacter ursingii TaxID=108980 RepID=UPI0021CDA123|nr:type IV pilus modification protein PilV [Acinetobacter ursingii]MCU4483014.1 type IV pilus modification protein PilV [Acinetobacter ursingii]MCU4507336.1 type IV pilus modification protein PilV [Acinetobacter ursingii]MCU4571220.1 type IV pilus modification protein PilV [Acinetobacter ursingii]
MILIKKQNGAGLIEVLVALLILAIGVLGFVALQYRAVEATSEAGARVQAINIAKDLVERIRVNRSEFLEYQNQLRKPESQKSYKTNCFTTNCSEKDLADFDVAQVVNKASSLSMTMNMMNCQGNNNNRSCVYVAWGDSSATNGTGTGDCTNGNAYNANSTCVIMEAY